MNREERRRTAKVLNLGIEKTPEDACILCAFVKVQVVGSREQLYKDQQGRRIELSISQRIEPPYGLRWPYDLQSRPPCPHCKGGKVTTINLQTWATTVSMCQECYGLGKKLRGDEFSPLCRDCAQFVYGWLETRAQAHMQKYVTAGGRLVVASPAQLTQMLAMGKVAQPATGLAKIGLPGVQR